jgi:hypothetical protein
MAAPPLGMASLLLRPVAGRVLDAEFLTRLHQRLLRLLSVLTSSLPAAVGMMRWEGRRSDLGASSPQSSVGYRIYKVPSGKNRRGNG